MEHEFSNTSTNDPVAKNPNKKWQELEGVMKELSSFMSEHGLETDRLPTTKCLVDKGMSSLVNAIKKYHGGRAALAESLRLKKEKSRHSRKEIVTIESVKKEIDDFIRKNSEEEGVMPLDKDMRANGARYISNHIRVLGGFQKVAELLGYSCEGSTNPKTWKNEDNLIDALFKASDDAQKIGEILTRAEYYKLGKGNLYQKLRRCEKGGGPIDIDTIRKRLQDRITKNPCKNNTSLSINEDIWKILDNPAIEEGLYFLLCNKFDWLKGIPEETISKWCNDQAKLPSGNGEVSKLHSISKSDLNLPIEVGTDETEFTNFLIVMVRICWVRLIKRLVDSKKPLTEAPSQVVVDRVITDLFPGKGHITLVQKVKACFIESIERVVNFQHALPNFGWGNRDLFIYQADVASRIVKEIQKTEKNFVLVADEPGLGKTASAIAGMAASGAKRIVVITNKMIADQTWFDPNTGEIAQCLARNYTIVRGVDNIPDDGWQQDEMVFVILHYQELQSHRIDKNGLTALDKLKAMNFDCLCLDEIHFAKKRGGCHKSITRSLVMELRNTCKAAIGLTGTPLLNDLSEPLSLLQLLSGNEEEFAFPDKKLSKFSHEEIAAVYEMMLPHMIRHQTQEVLHDLPQVNLKICRIASKTASINSGNWVDIRKQTINIKCQHILKRAIEDGKLLIFTHLDKGIGDEIKKYLQKNLENGIMQVGYICGKTSQEERQSLVKSFKDPAGIKILVATMATLGTGLTLFDPTQQETAHRIIIADLPFRYADLKQSICRLHRLGQKHIVSVEVLMYVGLKSQNENSHDRHVWKLLMQKKKIAQQAIDGVMGALGRQAACKEISKKLPNHCKKMDVKCALQRPNHPLKIGYLRIPVEGVQQIRFMVTSVSGNPEAVDGMEQDRG